MASNLEQAAAEDLESSETPIFSSVQELIKKNPNISVPNRYLRLHQEPPIPNLFNGISPHHSISIPTIDLESLLSKEDTELQLEKLHDVFKEWGIFQLVKHGVDPGLLEKLKHEMVEYYNLPVEEKMRYKIRPGEAEGCGTVARSDGKHDWGDGLYMITNPVHRRKPHLLPEFPSSLRKTLESYFLELQELGNKLIGMIAKALKKKEIEEMFEDGMQAVRMSYYPPCTKPEVVMGLTPHSDSSGITILNQVNGVNGLEIKKDGVWIPVRFHPDALVVNAGDILEIMSNGIYHSVEHRAAVNSVKERISIAFFISPKFEADVGPVTDIINPPLFKTVGMEDYIKTRSSRKIDGKSFLDSLRIQNGRAN